jgi:hypothetical protein
MSSTASRVGMCDCAWFVPKNFSLILAVFYEER